MVNGSKVQIMTDMLDQWHYFVSPIYSIKKLEFLSNVLEASNDSINAYLSENSIDSTYPVVQTGISDDQRILPLLNYTVNTAWNLLDEQGYNMEGLSTYFTEVWCQEHQKYSSMEYHVHRETQMVAFYFLECPEDCPKLVIHDPRPGKTMSELTLKTTDQLTLSSSRVYFTPEPGTLMFTNSWLPHSFTRNASEKPFKFIHMNINTRPYVPVESFPNTAEII